MQPQGAVARILTLLDDPYAPTAWCTSRAPTAVDVHESDEEPGRAAHGQAPGCSPACTWRFHRAHHDRRRAHRGCRVADAGRDRAVHRIVDAELEAAGDAPLTFFEPLTVLAFVAAPTPVDASARGRHGRGSTNTADGDVAVVRAHRMDHADRLGDTIEKIATVKAGIIRRALGRVGRASPEARPCALPRGSTPPRPEGDRWPLRTGLAWAADDQHPGPGGEYPDEHLPLHSAHQGHNAALAAAAGSLMARAQRIAADMSDGLQDRPVRTQIAGVARRSWWMPQQPARRGRWRVRWRQLRFRRGALAGIFADRTPRSSTVSRVAEVFNFTRTPSGGGRRPRRPVEERGAGRAPTLRMPWMRPARASASERRASSSPVRSTSRGRRSPRRRRTG